MLWQKKQRFNWVVQMLVAVGLVLVVIGASNLQTVEGRPHRILIDTDVDTDDFFALLYLLKLNRSEFELEAVTVNANAWTNPGHAVHQIYDTLYMMGRDDVRVGVGGEGGIKEDGTILPNVGGYLPIIEQRTTTAGGCRYRQAIPVGAGGRLDIDSNFGLRKSFLPQGSRRYTPFRQPTAQQVMIDKISAGPITVFLIGAHTNFALFLMSNPHLKKNVEHIYVMGGGVRSKNPTGCCPENSTSCVPRQCGDPGNVFTDYTSNPYAEFNFLGDPFAAYQVIHSGIPVTLVPLDATNTIPISQNFFDAFEKSQNTYEAQYIFQSLKMARDTWFDDQFYTSYFMWDSFTAGVAVSIMRNNSNNPNGENEFAEMEYMNITVITSNEPYGVTDGSNPFFDGLKVPKFNLDKNGVHSGHVQKGLRDPFCIGENGKGKCKDGYTEEVTGSEAVSMLVATKAKPNQDPQSPLDREFFISFLDVLNNPQQKGRFNLTTQFPFYKEVTYKPEFGNRKLGKPVVFDMDMSAGDFAALFYLLKVPIEVINLKAIIVSPTGWANAATIDVIYDLLHMMGRDDIPVGLGDVFATNQSDSIFSAVGDCKYLQAIPHGNGGLLDSDTLYGLARDLPRSPRRYTAENSLEFGAPRDTDQPELRQPLALEVWKAVVKTLDPGSKITVLTNGPLTNLAKIISSEKNTTSLMQDVYIVGGHLSSNDRDKGNVFTIPSNEYAEFNIFLDPLAAKTVFESSLNITLIPLGIQRKVSSFSKILERMRWKKKTPEANFARRLLSRLYRLQQLHHRYHHMQTFLGEILGAVLIAGDSHLNETFQVEPIKVYAEGSESSDGQLMIDENQQKLVRLLDSVDPEAYYDLFADRLSDSNQSAVLASFEEQVNFWRKPPNQSGTAP
ncbi:nucleoside hydrolase 3-like isoform X1 [Malus sylvestris]|uniref:nucleoside hydrolase 3-like isoform X1 n=2 Tax=Malus sylvestris TaxID=3752 RepID=UPI0021AC278C|nr:nucleoside hydrolase 3-like isoform X1 [Malus sylvestris]